MAYIGKAPASGIRNRFIYTATAGQTTFSGADDHSRTLGYTDAEYCDVYLNGVKLDKSDYTATSGTSVVLDEGAAVDDILEVVAYDTFSVFNGEFSQNVTVGGTLDMQGGEVILDADGDTSITADTDDQIDFKVGGADRMQLFGDASKFAVGTAWEDNTATSVDNAQFGSYTGGSYGILIKSGSTGSGGLSFADSTTSRTGGIFYQHSTERMEFFVSNGERIRIDNSGNVLLGKTSTGIDPMGCMIKPNGQYFSTVNGSDSYHTYDTSQNRYEFYVKGNGGIANYSGNNVNLSDQTEKKNITAAASTWDDVKGFTLKEFHYNFEDDDDPKRLGVIAQDVQTNHPDLIKTFKIDDTTTKLGVVEQQVTWMAIKALQEAMTKIETLETKVATLETENADFETRIAALEAN